MQIVFNDNNKNQTQLIEATQNKAKKVTETKKEVRFKSNETRRTELETFARPKQQASIQAPIESSGAKGRKSKNQKRKQQKQQQQQQRTEGIGDYKVENDDREELILPGYGGPDSRPTIPAYVQERLPPGVRLGNVTSLNTDQYRFYSFNQRLLSRFIPLWGERVRTALYQWLNENSAPAISKSWVTNVEVIMNDKGEILDVQPFRLSGMWSIDDAAIASFKQIRNVPHPPKEMIDENGYIHLQFQTEVLWVPQPGVRFHGNN